ncbi:MAG: Rpn family recombination-promoting nuclease/putative transposase, partial [Alphaproteobacteria bacterium]
MALKPSRFLSPTNDVVFKKIFGQHPDLMKSFLNGVLPLEEGHVIETIEYLTPEQSPRIPTMKATVADVKCIDQLGNIFIVEMQLHWTASFTKRLIFGTSKAYVQQLGRGKHYSSLCPVYGLGIINDVFDKASEEWFHHYRIVHAQDSKKVLKGLELVLLELPKFKPQTWLHKKMGVLWLRFLREINDKLVEVPSEFVEDPDVNKALEIAQESSYTLGELEAYDQYWDACSIEKTFIVDAENARAEVEKELTDAQKELEDSKKEIADSKKEIADSKKEIADSKK